MELISDIRTPGLAARLRPMAIAIGNFDGVHRGHHAVLAQTRAAARRLNARFGVLTFEPHPRSFFRPYDSPFRLTPPALKARRLERLGVETLVAPEFNESIAALSPEAFARDVLAGALGVAHVSIGENFRFGANRAGDAAALATLGRAHGFDVAVTPLSKDGSNGASEIVSSSAVRTALREGEVVEAARLLGDWHRVEGVVAHGEKRGRELGFPTANLELGDVLTPALGIYAVRAEVRGGPHEGAYLGVASLGVRPTFHRDAAPNLETYLFDFEGDIYGATLSVALCAYLRPELRFESVDALIAQMRRDEKDARAALASLTPPWPPQSET